jgi:hypothetical protein
MDLGDHAAAFPRHLRVEAIDNGQTVTLFDGLLAGAVLGAALADPARMPVVLAFDVHPHADHVRITFSVRNPDNPWRLNELRVLGHQ